jgi:hypothetical protein
MKSARKSNLKRGVIELQKEGLGPPTERLSVIQLNDTYKVQPSSNLGSYIHSAPEERRLHADSYSENGTSDHLELRITAQLPMGGPITPQTIEYPEGSTLGFAGSIVARSGGCGTIRVTVSGTVAVVSSQDIVCGTLIVGAVTPILPAS